jgi:diguanylate cyclase (GGDEF)-like protein
MRRASSPIEGADTRLANELARRRGSSRPLRDGDTMTTRCPPGVHASRSSADTLNGGFWLLQARVALFVMLAESAIVMGYLAATPHGVHRFAIWIIASSCDALGIVSLFVVVPMQASRTWRIRFSLAWSVATCIVTALVTALDGSVSSPLRSLFVVPVAFAGLMFPPVSVAITAATAIGAASLVSATDSHIGSEWPGLLIDFSVLIAIATISFAASLARTRLQCETDRLTQELADRATIDELTGCLTRRAFDEQSEAEVARSIRYGRPLAYIMMDVDNLKRINDTGGHSAGDRALASVGQTLREMSRAGDIVGRFGGDEFAILIPDGVPEGMIDMARRIHRQLSPGERDLLTLSYGGATLQDKASSLVVLREDADRALYEAKGSGRDQIVVHCGGSVKNVSLRSPAPALNGENDVGVAVHGLRVDLGRD